MAWCDHNASILTSLIMAMVGNAQSGHDKVEAENS